MPAPLANYDRDRRTGPAFDPLNADRAARIRMRRRAGFVDADIIGTEPATLFPPVVEARVERVAVIVVAFIAGWLAGIIQASTWH